MKIICNNYVTSKLEASFLPYIPDGDDLDNLFLVPDQGEKPHLQEITIYDSYLSTEDKIYSKLLDCTDSKSIINFHQQYGALNNPYHHASNNPHRNFQGLRGLIEEVSNALNIKKQDSEMKNGITLFNYTRIYYSEMKMLDYINHFLKTPQKNMSNFLSHCHFFLCDKFFGDLLWLEYNNVLDDIGEMLKATPIYYLRYLLTIPNSLLTSNSREKFNDDLIKSLTNINLDKPIIDCLLKIINYSESSKLDFSNSKFGYTAFEKKTFIRIAKQISKDMLEFHLHDTNIISSTHINQDDTPDFQYNFSSLASAIFFYYYIDSMGGIEFRICANPDCGKIFCCPKSSKKLYCSPDCNHRARQNRYRMRSRQQKEGEINFVSLNFTPWWIFAHRKYPEARYL